MKEKGDYMNKITAVKIVLLSAVMTFVLAACLNPLEIRTLSTNGMVDITITTRENHLQRALTSALAHASANYYEVVFQAPSGDYYRTTGYKGDTLRLSVPSGNYAGKAFQFAGTASDKTLLAVGVLPKGAEIINYMDTNIIFDLKVLKADVNDAGTVFGESIPPDSVFSYDKGNKVRFDNRIVPYYRIQAGKTYRLSYRLNDDNSLPAPIANNIIFNNYAGAFEKGVASWGLISDDYNEKPIALIDAEITNTDGDDFTKREIEIMFSTPASPTLGWSTLNFSCPVSAMSTEVPHGDIWYIRGGLANSQLDAGGYSTGGTLVFGIGNPLCNIIVNGGW